MPHPRACAAMDFAANPDMVVEESLKLPARVWRAASRACRAVSTVTFCDRRWSCRPESSSSMSNWPRLTGVNARRAVAAHAGSVDGDPR